MADVTVRGAGIFGLCIAWSCIRRGAAVTVVDPNGPGAGASGGILGALAPHVPENWNEKKEFQRDALLSAEAYWRAVEAESGAASSYARIGRLQPIMDAHALALAEQRIEGARQHWLDAAEWRVLDAPPENVWAPASPIGRWVYDTLSARIFPRRACAALASAITARGGEIVTKAANAGAVVDATGVEGLVALNKALGKTVGNGVKGQAALLRHDAGPFAPQLFVDGLHIVPHDGGLVAVGATTERDYASPTETDHQLDALIARVRGLLPVLQDAPVVERWAGLRPRTKSRAPMIGAHPLFDGHYIANGGFKIGLAMAPRLGEIMADLILEGRDAIPAEFHPARSL